MSHRSALGLVLTWHDAARFADLPSEEVLSRYLASREEAAFRELLRRHAGHVWAVCRRELTCLASAEDAFQTTFLTLIRKGHRVRQPGSLAGWLDSVARRAAADVRRNRARRAEVERAVPVKEPTTDTDRVEAIREAVAELPERYRLPVTYRFLSGLSVAEVSGVLGVPEETGRTRLKRGVELLRAKLGGKGLGIGVGTAGGTVSMEAALTAAAERVPQTLLAATVQAVQMLPVQRGILATMAAVVTYKRAVVGMTVLTFGMAGALMRAPGSRSEPGHGKSAVQSLKDPPMRGSPLLALAAAIGISPAAPAQTFTKIVDTSTAIPNGTGAFTGFSVEPPHLSGTTVAFYGQGNGGQQGYYTGSVGGGPLVRLADLNTPIPNGVGNFSTFMGYHNLKVSGSTAVIYGRDSNNRPGIYTVPTGGGALTMIADTNTPIPNGTGNFTTMMGYNISGSTVGFWAGDGMNATNQMGVYTAPATGGPLTVIANQNTPIPGGTGNFRVFTNEVDISGSTILFVGHNSSMQPGIYAGPISGGPLTRLVDTNTAIPNGSGNFSYFTSHRLSGSAFVFEGRTSSLPSSDQAGVYAGSISGGPLIRIVDQNTPIPGGSGDFTGRFTATVSGSLVAFSISQEAGGQGGIYLSSTSGGPITKVITTGETLDGRTVSRLNFRDGLDGSILVFTAVFTDGTQAVYAFTPVPEPAGVLAVSAAAAVGALGLGRWMLGGF